MTDMHHLTTPQGRRIACHLTPGKGPTVVFLGGLMSDMTGTKAVWLQDWCRARGQGYLRFDYSGHGQSSGAFTDGCIGDWAEDARAAIAQVDGPLILVGSSMGGWISVLLAQQMARVAGLVTIAAAPDFTAEMLAEMDDAARAELASGVTYRPSDYGDPYPITRRLIEDGPAHFVLTRPFALAMPVRMLLGSADALVSTDRALRLLNHMQAGDAALTLLKGADHSFSAPDCLPLIARAILDVMGET